MMMAFSAPKCTEANTHRSIPTILFPPPNSPQTSYCLHLAKELLLTVSQSLVQEERHYVKESLHQNGCPERFLSSQHSPPRKDREKDDPRFCVTIPYVQGVLEVLTRILSDIDVQVHMKPHRTLRRILSHPTDCILDGGKCIRSIVVTVMLLM